MLQSIKTKARIEMYQSPSTMVLQYVDVQPVGTIAWAVAV